MSDRGMKKWAPYSSLNEQATCLEEMKYQRNKIAKPILTEVKRQVLQLRMVHDAHKRIKPDFPLADFLVAVLVRRKDIH